MILILLFFILIFILLKFYLYEGFSNNLIKYLTISEACNELKSINNTLNYHKNDYNSRNINKNYKYLSEFYCENLIEFSDKDKIVLNWLLSNVFKHIDIFGEKINKNFRFFYTNIKIAKYNNSVENGFPHTHKDIIFIHEHFIDDCIEYYNNNDIDMAIKTHGSIIFHELVHIWQRRMPDKFHDLFTNYWHFTNEYEVVDNYGYKDNIRYNPDGPINDYVLNINDKYIWILCLYNQNPKNIGDVNYKAVYLEKKDNKLYSSLNTKNLLDCYEFKYMFHNLLGNHYHVNEISAELMTIYFLNSLKLNYKKFSNIGYKNMKLWVNSL